MEMPDEMACCSIRRAIGTPRFEAMATADFVYHWVFIWYTLCNNHASMVEEGAIACTIGSRLKWPSGGGGNFGLIES